MVTVLAALVAKRTIHNLTIPVLLVLRTTSASVVGKQLWVLVVSQFQ
jgi:hypothetical protein